MPMTVTEVVQAARDEIAGASSVKVKDRGQTTPEMTRDGSLRTVAVRDYDAVHIVVKADEQRWIEITISRLKPDDAWLADVDAEGVEWENKHHAYKPIEVNGSGDITQLIHRARTTLGLPIPKGTPHPSNLYAFRDDISPQVLHR
jgi:hypothetical protein